MVYFLLFFRPLAILSTLGAAKLHVHDGSFVPDQILRVTAQNFSQGCLSRYSVLVNGEMLVRVFGHAGSDMMYRDFSWPRTSISGRSD